MAQKKLNKEIDRLFLGVGVTKSITFSKPRNRRPMLAIALMCLVSLVAALLFFWLRAPASSTLARHLPEDTAWYFSMTIPEVRWYHHVPFFSSRRQALAQASRLSQKLDMLHWQDFDFRQDIVPAFGSVFEAAGLPDGTVVLYAAIEDRQQWYALVDLADSLALGDATGTIAGASGYLAQISQQKNWVWRLSEDGLYLVSSEEAWQQLDQLPESRKTLDGVTSRTAIITLYLQTADAFGSRLFDFLSSASQDMPYPITFFVEPKPNGILSVRTNKEQVTDVSDQKPDSLKYTLASPISDAWIFSTDFGESIETWVEQARQFGDNARVREDAIVSAFSSLYQADLIETGKEGVIKEVGALVRSGESSDPWFANEWLIVARGLSNTPDSSIAALLEEAGANLFAILHPIVVEKILADGSIMKELRADSNDTDWSVITRKYGGSDAELRILRATEETDGFITGFIPGMGHVLSNASGLLDDVLQTTASKAAYGETPDSCIAAAGNHTILSFSGNSFIEDDFVSQLIDRVVIVGGRSGALAACVKFKTQAL